MVGFNLHILHKIIIFFFGVFLNMVDVDEDDDDMSLSQNYPTFGQCEMYCPTEVI